MKIEYKHTFQTLDESGAYDSLEWDELVRAEQSSAMRGWRVVETLVVAESDGKVEFMHTLEAMN